MLVCGSINHTQTNLGCDSGDSCSVRTAPPRFWKRSVTALNPRSLQQPSLNVLWNSAWEKSRTEVQRHLYTIYIYGYIYKRENKNWRHGEEYLHVFTVIPPLTHVSSVLLSLISLFCLLRLFCLICLCLLWPSHTSILALLFSERLRAH